MIKGDLDGRCRGTGAPPVCPLMHGRGARATENSGDSAALFRRFPQPFVEKNAVPDVQRHMFRVLQFDPYPSAGDLDNAAGANAAAPGELRVHELLVVGSV